MKYQKLFKNKKARFYENHLMLKFLRDKIVDFNFVQFKKIQYTSKEYDNKIFHWYSTTKLRRFLRLHSNSKQHHKLEN